MSVLLLLTRVAKDGSEQLEDVFWQMSALERYTHLIQTPE
jgi:hypothetical protein